MSNPLHLGARVAPPAPVIGADDRCYAQRMGLLDRALNIGESKQFREYEKRVDRINAYEPELELESDDELRDRFKALRERADDGESLDDLLPETFAIVREIGKRTMG